jgi:hypothetical protein
MTTSTYDLSMAEIETGGFRLDRHSTMNEPAEEQDGAQGRKEALTAHSSSPLPANREQSKLSDRVTRKRLQNRLSQQCVREKRLAHAKQFEALRDMPKLAHTSQLSQELWETLKAEQLALAEENRRLKDALLKMRKKLLSLSSMAAMTAGTSTYSPHPFY